MEQDCVACLYRSLGLSLGAEFSSEDASLLYRKMFHVPSSTDEAHQAMRKISGGDNNWSCVGENVLDVLIEMEREREKKEKLYWELQLLNVGNLNPLHGTSTPGCLHQSTDSSDTHNSALASLQCCTVDILEMQRERELGNAGQRQSLRIVKRLKKAGRQSWAQLATEGVRSMMASPWQSKNLPRFRGQAWGCVSLSDVLLLVEVKYDVVTHLLYTEMLQEHHTLNVWETLLPWQRHKEEEGLEDLAEEALESGDMLRLAELPGAFRTYRAFPATGMKCWSAISLLYQINTSRQRERDTLTVLGERLDRENLRLSCLYIRLATLKAQREKMSYSALLAARQSWETWPHVSSPCRAEQAVIWLHSEEEEQQQMRDFISASPEQAVLQLLVLTQERERRHLVHLIREVSLEDLHWSGCAAPPNKEEDEQASLWNGCIKKLRQIHGTLQTHREIQNPLQQTQARLQPQTQRGHLGVTQALWSQGQLEDCALALLSQLMELQRVQSSAILPALIEKSGRNIQTLRDEYESKLEDSCHTTLLHLLTSDAPLTPGSVHIPNSNLIQNSSEEQMTAQASCSPAPAEAQKTSVAPAEALMVPSIRRASRELNGGRAEDAIHKWDVCTGCGVAVEGLPYLEILCVSDSTSNTEAGYAAQGGWKQEDSGATKSPQSDEKQGSLITLAWSKPPEDDSDFEGEAADVRKNGESGLNTQIQLGDLRCTAEHTLGEATAGESCDDVNPAQFQCGSTGHPDVAPSAEQQCRKEEELSMEEGRSPETLQVGLVAGSSNATSNSSREALEVDACAAAAESEIWDLKAPEPAPLEDNKGTSQATAGCSIGEKSTPTESERAREAASTMERERTMRNLVDMQRKVEQRQQRDRERQLLRVQERLSIIQNRKAEEDLLGFKHVDRLRHLTNDLPQEDKKTVVREQLEHIRRERSYVMQSKRDRNTAGFKELLGPVGLHSRQTEDGAD